MEAFKSPTATWGRCSVKIKSLIDHRVYKWCDNLLPMLDGIRA
jgi:hypothetical protein